MSNVDTGIYLSDELLTRDITLTVDPAATLNFYGEVNSGGKRLGDGSVPNLDAVMADMGFTEKTVGPPDLYNYAVPTDVGVDGIWGGSVPGTEVAPARPMKAQSPSNCQKSPDEGIRAVAVRLMTHPRTTRNLLLNLSAILPLGI